MLKVPLLEWVIQNFSQYVDNVKVLQQSLSALDRELSFIFKRIGMIPNILISVIDKESEISKAGPSSLEYVRVNVLRCFSLEDIS